MATLDFSIADISDGVVEILATYGDVFCGGSDVDKAIADMLVEEFKNEQGIDLSLDTMAYARVYEAAEKAKIELSNASKADINLPYLTARDGQPLHLISSLTKAKFEQLIEPIIKHAMDCGEVALKESGLKATDLDGILLVGGSCRIPLMQEFLTKTFGVELIKSSNLDECVAQGAAVQGGIISGDTKTDIILMDLTPLRYGIETLGGVMTTIVEANTAIPCKKSQIFSTAVDNQPAVTIKVLQGLRPMAKDNKVIGEFNLDGILPAQKGVPQIEVTFNIDTNGILSVSAIDKGTNKEQNITIETKTGLSDADIERIKEEAKANEAADAEAKKHADTVNACESAIWQTEKQLKDENFEKLLTDEDKTFFNEKIEVLKKMQTDNDYSNFDSVAEEMNQRMYAISAKAYQQSQGQDGANAADFMKDMFKNGGATPGTEEQPEDVK